MPSDKVIEKTVNYQGHVIKLYSLDGIIWSSNRAELTVIKERLHRKKLELLGVKDVGSITEPLNSDQVKHVKEVKKRARKVRDITKNIVEIKAEEIKETLSRNLTKHKPKVNYESKRLNHKRDKAKQLKNPKKRLNKPKERKKKN